MSPTPRVSVIIIFLDPGEFLREAVESVFAQSYGTWELLLVDDGSTDGSTDYARREAAREPGRVRYLEHEAHRNRGMSASRNLGIAHARGEYLAFLDADDVWLPHKLERQVDVLDSRSDAAMVYGAPINWYSWTGEPADLERDEVPALHAPLDTTLAPPELFLMLLAGEAPPPWPSDVLVRRAAADAVGGFEDAFRGMYEDQAFFAKLLLRYPAIASSECSMRYRQHPGSCYTTAKRTGKHRRARHFYLRWLRRHLAAQRVQDPQIWRTFHEKCRPFRLSYRIRVIAARLLRGIAAVVTRVGRLPCGPAGPRRKEQVP